MSLECLDGTLRRVGAVVSRRDCFNFCSILFGVRDNFLRDFVVDALKNGVEAGRL